MYVIIRGMSGKLGVGILALAAFCASVWGEVISPPPLPGSAYADTEVATNIPFNSERNDARGFGVEMSFTGTASNCIQIAFGRDADRDGDLAPEETRMMLGWRAGSYFIEDAAGGVRIVEEAEAVPNDLRSLSLHVALDSSFRLRSAAATNETGECFLALREAEPDWLCGAGWNLMKLTRRGVDAVNEAVSVECQYSFFRIGIR